MASSNSISTNACMLEPSLERIKQGDTSAFESFFRKHYNEVFQNAFFLVGQKEVAEELTQDVFVKMWQKRTTINIRESARAYLKTAIKNTAINYLKSRLAQAERHLSLDYLAEEPFTPMEYSSDEALNQKIQQAIQQLPERCRIVFTLSRQAGMTYEEVASELGITKESVKTQIKIAFKKLREALN